MTSLQICCEKPELLQTHIQALRDLCRVESVEKSGRKGACATAVVQGQELYIPLEGVIDIDAEIERLNKELGKSEKDIASLEKRLGNPGFTDRAPAHVVAEFTQKLDSARDKCSRLSDARDLLCGPAPS